MFPKNLYILYKTTYHERAFMVDENRGETNVEYLTQFDTLGGLHEIDNGGYQVSDEDRREIMNALSSDRKDISANNKSEEKKLDGFIAKHPDLKINTENSVVYSGRLQDFDVKDNCLGCFNNPAIASKLSLDISGSKNEKEFFQKLSDAGALNLFGPSVLQEWLNKPFPEILKTIYKTIRNDDSQYSDTQYRNFVKNNIEQGKDGGRVPDVFDLCLWALCNGHRVHVFNVTETSAVVWQGGYDPVERTDVGQNEPFRDGDLIITRNHPNNGEWTLSEVKSKVKSK